MQIMTDFLVVTGLALIFLALSWAFGRAVSGGRQLNTFKRKLLLYSFVFVLGEAYIMMLVSDLTWPTEVMLPLIAAWAVAVGLVALLRYRRHRAQHVAERHPPATGV